MRWTSGGEELTYVPLLEDDPRDHLPVITKDGHDIVICCSCTGGRHAPKTVIASSADREDHTLPADVAMAAYRSWHTYRGKQAAS